MQEHWSCLRISALFTNRLCDSRHALMMPRKCDKPNRDAARQVSAHQILAVRKLTHRPLAGHTCRMAAL